MTSYQAKGNTSHGHSIQINGPVYGSATELQPSFFYTSNYESYKNINPQRVPKTCVWFLEHPIFQKWKASSGDDLLWLSADPGCGKSVLSRALVDEKLVGPDSVTLCHFFFKDNEEQNNTTAALCALLHQFFWAHNDLLLKHADSAVKKCGQALQGDFEELWRTFLSAATDPSAGDVICILDALDECRQPDRYKLITHLEDFYSRSLDKAERESKLKFLVTSRPYDDIERRFRKLTRRFPTIRLAGEEESENISREIGIVMQAKVEEIAEERRLGEDVQSSLQSRLCEIPNRTYLWLHLTLDEVRQALGKTEKKLLKVIDTLPGTVEEAYEKILARCVQKEARKVLQIIVAAQRPLTLREIDVALEIELDLTSYEDLDLEGDENRKRSIRECCGLFITVLDSRVHLIHQTAREFLVRKNEETSGLQRWKHSIDLQEAHRTLSEICIVYLHFREIRGFHKSQEYQQFHTSQEYQKFHKSQEHQNFHEGGEIIEDAFHSRLNWAARQYAAKYAFLDYSAKHWIYHVREAHINSDTWVSKTAMLCDVSDGLPCAWFSLCNGPTTWTSRRKKSVVDWAVAFELVNETRYLLDSGLDPIVGINDFDDALKVAARNQVRGKELVTVFLESRRGNVKITERLVIEAAANKGIGKEIIELLLERRGDEVKITENVVVAAAENGSIGKEIIALLLERRGDEVKITEKVVKAAVGRWSFGKEIIELLLERRGNEVKITEKVAVSAVNNELIGKEMIELLLERRGDEVKITEKVVEAAAGNPSFGKEIIELLLERRGHEFKITEKVVEGAAGNGSIGKEIIELLLEQRGDEVKITENVVVAAAENWSIGKEIIALLLERRGDEIKITEKLVEAAAGNGSIGKEIIELLLERRGDEVKITERLVIEAVENRFIGKEIIELLFERRGDEIKITEKVVKAAVRNQRIGKEIIELLLERRGDKFVISAGLLFQIAELFGQEAITLLLGQRRNVNEIIEEVVKEAAAAAAAATATTGVWKQRNGFEQHSPTLFRRLSNDRWIYFSLKKQV